MKENITFNENCTLKNKMCYLPIDILKTNSTLLSFLSTFISSVTKEKSVKIFRTIGFQSMKTFFLLKEIVEHKLSTFAFCCPQHAIWVIHRARYLLWKVDIKETHHSLRQPLRAVVLYKATALKVVPFPRQQWLRFRQSHVQLWIM